MCVCERERNRERERGKSEGEWGHFHTRELQELVSGLVSGLSCNCHHQVTLVEHPGELGSADRFVLT